jgi:Peptidase family C78
MICTAMMRDKQYERIIMSILPELSELSPNLKHVRKKKLNDDKKNMGPMDFCSLMYERFGISTALITFPQGGDHCIFSCIQAYFIYFEMLKNADNNRCVVPPLFLQKSSGHSVTVVGLLLAESRKYLLVFDPLFTREQIDYCLKNDLLLRDMAVDTDLLQFETLSLIVSGDSDNQKNFPQKGITHIIANSSDEYIFLASIFQINK